VPSFLALTRPPVACRSGHVSTTLNYNLPFAFTITLGSTVSNPLADHPYVRIDGPRKRSHLNANNALIVRATRGCSHRKRGPPLSILSSSLGEITTLSYPRVRTLRLPLFTTLPLLPRYDLCPWAMSFRDIIMSYRNVTSHLSLSSHVIVVEPQRSATTIGVMTRRVSWQGKSLNFHELETRPLSTNGCLVKGC